MCPLMQAYNEIRRYGIIEHDNRCYTSAGWHRYVIIWYHGTTYAISMLDGDVLKIEAIGEIKHA